MSSEYKHTISKVPVGTVAGSPPQNYSNAGSGFGNQSLTIGNGATIALAGSSAAKIVRTGYGTLVDQIGDARLEQTLGNISRGLGYAGIALINPVVAGATIAVDLATFGIKRVVYEQDTSFENEYKRKTRGKDTSLGGSYG